MLTKTKLGIITKPAPHEEDNATVIEMRRTLEQQRKDIDSFKTQITTLGQERDTFKTKLSDIEKSNMDEITRVKTENTELLEKLNLANADIAKIEPLQKRLIEVHKHIESDYEKRLKLIPEKEMEKVKKLTFVEGDPVASALKLETTLEILYGEEGLKAGSLVIGGGLPDSEKEKKQDKKYDPKNISWADALRPRAEVLEEYNNRGRRGAVK